MAYFKLERRDSGTGEVTHGIVQLDDNTLPLAIRQKWDRWGPWTLIETDVTADHEARQNLQNDLKDLKRELRNLRDAIDGVSNLNQLKSVLKKMIRFMIREI